MIEAAHDKLVLGPPKEFLEAARATLGGIDFDPFSTRRLNAYTGARRFIDVEAHDAFQDAVQVPWKIPVTGRLAATVAAGAPVTRHLFGRVLENYRSRHVISACLLTTHQEILRTAPWVHDFPLAFPFRRLSCSYWDDELEEVRFVRSSQWSVVVFLPPCDQPEEHELSMIRFHAAFGALGRITYNEYAGDRRWRDAYQAQTGKPYSPLR